VKTEKNIEIDYTLDLAHTENPTRRIKPPQREFHLLKLLGSRRYNEEMVVPGDSKKRCELSAPDSLYKMDSHLHMAVDAHGDGLHRIRVWKNEIPESWAVTDLPASVAVDSLSASIADQSPVFTMGELSIGEWRFHPEALRFSIVCDGELPRVYGLGEKMGRLERSGRVWDMWNTDEPEHLPNRDPLYVSIPFALISVQKEWYGVFVDNPARQYWDTALSRNNTITIDVEDQYLDIYLFKADSPRSLLRKYTSITGTSPLPPVWGIGYHQSRYSYFPDTEVRRIARNFRRHKLPADVIQIDIDYMSGYRVFTWNKIGFPDPGALLADLRAEGFRVVTIVDPGIKADPTYSVYKEGADKEYFCKLPDGSVYTGAVWPGESVYPDFSRSAVRSWWASMHSELFKYGVSGIWNDMNEPADFTGDPVYRPNYTVPNELQAVTDTGTPVSFARFHNLYSAGMNRGTREAFHKHLPDRRGFVITRSGYAGLQRDAGVWTGDNCSWWEHLAAAIPMLLGLSISGVSLVGSDTGGFQENASAQLYARWFAFSAFTPYFRSHTADDTRAHEPWSFGSNVLEISRHYLELRYSLIPYLYTAFYWSEIYGEPVMKPLFFDWPQDERLAEVNDEYMFGEGFLVAPVTSADHLWRHVYFPEGNWYDFWDDSLFQGPSDRLILAPIGKLPLFVKGGSIVPHEAPRMHTDAQRGSVLKLDVYPDENAYASGKLYCDAEEGWEYRNGEYSLISFSFNGGTLSVEFLHADYTPHWKKIDLRVHDSRYVEDTADVVSDTETEKTADPQRLESVFLPTPFADRHRIKMRKIIPLREGRWLL